MDRKFQCISGAIRAFVCALCLTSAACAQGLPEGKGKAELADNCTTCHSTGIVIRSKKTTAEWRKTVDAMVARGASGSKEDIDNIVLYLDTNFATDRPGAPAPVAAPASAPPALDTAKRVIAESGCLACHRVEKQGGYIGPSLNGVGSRRTPEEIRSAILHPHPKLDPDHLFVQLTTADGKSVSGRILTQTGHDLRVIDMAGDTANYPKQGLRQLTLVDTNPMPPYEGKIPAPDLDELVRYLGTLPAVDETVQK